MTVLKIQEDDYNELLKKVQRYEKALLDIMLMSNYNSLKAKGIAEKALKN